MYLCDVFTVGVNLAGLPAISVPCGFTAERLPIGLQLIGRAMGEVTILRAADALERATTFARELPPDVRARMKKPPSHACPICPSGSTRAACFTPAAR